MRGPFKWIYVVFTVNTSPFEGSIRIRLREDPPKPMNFGEILKEWGAGNFVVKNYVANLCAFIYY